MATRLMFPVLVIIIALSGCSQMRPLAPVGCNLPAYRLTLGQPEDFLPAAQASETARAIEPGVAKEQAQVAESPEKDDGENLVQVLSKRYSDRVIKSDDLNHQVLILSGGSQHGAFGAGFFVGLEEQRSIPNYDVVTGVSTGSLQSTFIFLANEPVPPDLTNYPAYMEAYRQHPDPILGAPGVSNVRNLALAYAISNESDLLRVYSHHQLGLGIAAIRHGSLAQFTPLRAALTQLITVKTIEEVATEAKDHGRSLLVGATDIDDGYAYAIDLTGLAGEALESQKDGVANAESAAVGCYVDALIASSSVPPGVPPVSLTIHSKLTGTHTDLFIDGGARYGVFFDQIRKAFITDGKLFDMTLLVNGQEYDGQWEDGGQRPQKWNILTLAERSSNELIDQIYRYSVFNEKVWAVANDKKMYYAYISKSGLPNMTTPPGEWGYNGQSCDDASNDDDKQHPQEFHPKYMRCLIDYGQHRAEDETNRWNKVYSPPIH